MIKGFFSLRKLWSYDLLIKLVQVQQHFFFFWDLGIVKLKNHKSWYHFVQRENM